VNLPFKNESTLQDSSLITDSVFRTQYAIIHSSFLTIASLQKPNLCNGREAETKHRIRPTREPDGAPCNAGTLIISVTA
jgi:hypothetical protein